MRVAALALRSGQEHPEQAPVGNGAAAGHREPLRAWAAAQGARGAVPDQPRAQLREFLARVAARQHVQHRVEHAPGEPAERGRPPDELLHVADLPVVHRHHGDDLLGKHVERVARHAQFLDLAVPHALHDHGRLDQVTWVLREDHAAGDVAHLVPGTAGALHPARHRRRRLHLDDQVHGAHVDAEFQAGRGHHGRQPPRLQRLLDLCPLLPGHRAVMRAGHLGRGTRRGAGLRHDLRRRPRGRTARLVQACSGLVAGLRPVRGDLVQPAAQPLGQAPRVGEHDRRPVRLDQVEHLLLDVRPDGPLALRGVTQIRFPRGCAIAGCAGRRSEAGGRWIRIGHVLDRDDDPQLHLLDVGGCRDRHRPGAAEECGHLLRRPDGGRQPDPLGRPGGLARHGAAPQRVQPFQRDGQVRAALVAGQGVYLVHDDGVHAAQRVARLGGQDEEQRFGRGDQDVRRLAGHPPPLVGTGVAGAHRHPDVRLGQPAALRDLADPGQRGAQVPLDVHRQGLER